MNPPTSLRLINLSSLTRFGVKGSHAADWLAEQGVSIPAQPNCWLPLSDGGLVARLGFSEFLIEDQFDSQIALNLSQQYFDRQSFPARVYPVLRQDFAVALWGDLLYELMAQTCSINLRALDLAQRPVLLTTMIGVAVTLLPDQRSGQPFYRIWCDGTFGEYVWQTLWEIAAELGGEAAGMNSLTQEQIAI